MKEQSANKNRSNINQLYCKCHIISIQKVLLDDFTLIKISGEGLDNLKINRHLKLRYSRGGLEKYNTKSHLNTFLNHSKFNISILRRSSYIRQNNFGSYLKEKYIFPVLSLFSIIHSIKVYWKRKSYLSWGGFDQKVLLPN